MTVTARRPSFTPGARSATHIPPSREERREIEADLRRDRIAQHGPAMIALIAEAKAFREKWGVYTWGGWRFDAIYGTYIHEIDEIAIRASMKKTLARAAERAAQALETPYTPVDGDNDMSDAEVAAGIRWLRAGGLSAYDRSTGHFCHAMLDIDYPAAIAVARTIIRKYRKSLEKAGVL